jgi:hypothetical protein
MLKSHNERNGKITKKKYTYEEPVLTGSSAIRKDELVTMYPEIFELLNKAIGGEDVKSKLDQLEEYAKGL